MSFKPAAEVLLKVAIVLDSLPDDNARCRVLAAVCALEGRLEDAAQLIHLANTKYARKPPDTTLSHHHYRRSKRRPDPDLPPLFDLGGEG